MKVEIEIACDNAAFEPEPEFEVARILRKYADQIERSGEVACPLMDYNGNRVGRAIPVYSGETK